MVTYQELLASLRRFDKLRCHQVTYSPGSDWLEWSTRPGFLSYWVFLYPMVGVFIPSQFSFNFFPEGGGEAWWVAKALILLWHFKSQSVGLDSILLNSQRVPLFFSVFPSTTDSWYSAYIPQDAFRWGMEWICLPAGTTIPRLVKHLFLFCRKGQLPYILSQRHKIKFFFIQTMSFLLFLFLLMGGVIVMHRLWDITVMHTAKCEKMKENDSSLFPKIFRLAFSPHRLRYQDPIEKLAIEAVCKHLRQDRSLFCFGFFCF